MDNSMQINGFRALPPRRIPAWHAPPPLYSEIPQVPILINGTGQDPALGATVVADGGSLAPTSFSIAIALNNPSRKSSYGHCKDLHDFFKDVFVGFFRHATSTTQSNHRSTNVYAHCFLCPFTAPGVGPARTTSLAQHFETAHLSAAVNRYYLKKASPLDHLLVFHFASIRGVPPIAGYDDAAVAKERTRFHSRFRDYNRAKPVLNPDGAVYRALAAYAHKLVERTVTRKLEVARNKFRCHCGNRFLTIDFLEAHLVESGMDSYITNTRAKAEGQAAISAQHGWTPADSTAASWLVMQNLSYRVFTRVMGESAIHEIEGQ